MALLGRQIVMICDRLLETKLTRLYMWSHKIEKEAAMTNKLQMLIDASRSKPMSDAEKEAQRRSFAFGNANIENARVTREMVAAAAEKIKRVG